MAESLKRDQWKEWMEEFQAESDRSCAVLGAAFLDEHLRSLLDAYFVDDAKRVAELLEGGGPLSSFSSRIGLA